MQSRAVQLVKEHVQSPQNRVILIFLSKEEEEIENYIETIDERDLKTHFLYQNAWNRFTRCYSCQIMNGSNNEKGRYIQYFCDKFQHGFQVSFSFFIELVSFAMKQYSNLIKIEFWKHSPQPPFLTALFAYLNITTNSNSYAFFFHMCIASYFPSKRSVASYFAFPCVETHSIWKFRLICNLLCLNAITAFSSFLWIAVIYILSYIHFKSKLQTLICITYFTATCICPSESYVICSLLCGCVKSDACSSTGAPNPPLPKLYYGSILLGSANSGCVICCVFVQTTLFSAPTARISYWRGFLIFFTGLRGSIVFVAVFAVMLEHDNSTSNTEIQSCTSITIYEQHNVVLYQNTCTMNVSELQ